MGFEIVESGDLERPWAVWDKLEETVWDHYATRLEAAEALVKIEWQIRSGR